MRESATQTGTQAGTQALSRTLSMRTRARLAGIFILTAYFVLAYGVTDNPGIVFVFEVFSGLSVIGIALMLYPLLRDFIRVVDKTYYALKWIEGIIMIAGGTLFLVNTETALAMRDTIYVVHLYAFIISGGLLYLLCYKTQLIPRWMSIWGMVAVVLLTANNIFTAVGIELHMAIAGIFFAQIVLNEIVMAGYLIVHGFVGIQED